MKVRGQLVLLTIGIIIFTVGSSLKPESLSALVRNYGDVFLTSPPPKPSPFKGEGRVGVGYLYGMVFMKQTT